MQPIYTHDFNSVPLLGETIGVNRRWLALLAAALLIAVAFPPTPRDADAGTITATTAGRIVPGQPLATTFAGPSSCANPGFLTGDTVADGNPAALYTALCD